MPNLSVRGVKVEIRNGTREKVSICHIGTGYVNFSKHMSIFQKCAAMSDFESYTADTYVDFVR